MNIQGIHHQLGQLLARTPTIPGQGPIPPDAMRWIAQVSALLEHGNAGTAEMFSLTTAASHLGGPNNRELNFHTILTVAQRVFARLEYALPASDQGTFIQVGHQFDTLLAFAKILGSAQQDAMLVEVPSVFRLPTGRSYAALGC